MYGRVTKYYHDRGFGFILGEEGNTYFIHHSKLCGEYIEKGYYVYFKPFQNDRSDYNAKGIVIVDIPEKDVFSVSAKYSCGFPDPQVSPIIVVDRYLDYFTTIMEDRL